MGVNLTVVLPREAVDVFSAAEAAAPPRVQLEARFQEEIDPGDEAPPELVARTQRLELSGAGEVSVALGAVHGAAFTLAILNSDGTESSSRQLKVAEDQARYTISAADVRQLLAGAMAPPPAAPRTVTRSAQFVAMGGAAPAFKQSRLSLTVVDAAAQLEVPAPLSAFGFSAQQMASLEVPPPLRARLGTLPWAPASLGVDGRFVAVFRPEQSTLGWVWWLDGERQLVGFVPDDVSQPSRTPTVIALPPLAPLLPSDGGGPAPCPVCAPAVPADVTETELADNPGVYAEDPGAFCKPFSNPERVLSEKTFAVIARVQQPDIGALGSAKIRTQHLLDLAPAQAITVADTGRGTAIRVMTAPGRDALVDALLNTALPTRHRPPAQEVQDIGQMPSGRTLMDAQHPLQWEDDIAQYQAATVALGHILEFRVRARSNGYSLGTVASTLTLAPRQTKRIQKISFQRLESARREEQTQLTDQVSDETTRERDYNDTVSAYLSEWASGSSSAGTAAAAGGFGFAIPPVVGGVGGGASKAWSRSEQEGGRNTTAAEQQRLRDAIRRHGDAQRRLQSTVVTEVSQEETVTGTTETVRNPNYGHSLTVIYYQILRHLKVSTEFAGARECLFVPFAIRPFTLQRAYRWREALQRYMRSPQFGNALAHLRDVATSFQFSNLLPGTRAQQPLSYLRGSIYLTLAIERPGDKSDGSYDAAQWQALAPFLGSPGLGIWSGLAAQAAALRDQAFQQAHAPAIAAKWCNKLRVAAGAADLAVDATLATRYAFNGTVRVDFSVPAGRAATLTRGQLQTLYVLAGAALPPGSVANVSRVTLRYGTARYERSIDSLAGISDLVEPGSGAVDAGAQLDFPLDAWDQVDERQQLTHSVNELIEHLNEHVEFYHKAIWWSMDRDRLLMMLDGFYVPGTNKVSIASVVDREPLAIIGNSLVYRVGAGSYIGYDKMDSPRALHDLYAETQPLVDPILLSLPTDGLYAQAIMDECLALEEHQGSVDWALGEQEPDLGSIDPSLLASRRADLTPALTPSALPATLINLQNAPEAPAPAGLQGVLSAVTNANAFRDMAGLAGTQANAAQALQTAAALATNFGNQAAALKLAELAKNAHDAQTADQKLATVQRALDKNLTTPEDAQRHTSQILESLHAPGAPAPPHEDPAIGRAISAAAGQAGSSIEASTADGQVKVSMGAAAAPAASDQAAEPDRVVSPLAWLEGHGGELARDPLFDRGESTLPDLAFVEGEHLNIGQSIMAVIDAWAMAGLIDGGAMIDVRQRSNGIAAPVVDWNIVVPDLDHPGQPYAALPPLTRAHWHYIVPDPVYEDPATHTRWTSDTLRQAIQQGRAAALTFGQLVFLAGDWVGSFADLHMPGLFASPVGVMKALAQHSPLAYVMLDVMQNGSGSFSDLSKMYDAAREGHYQPNANLDQLLAAFEQLRVAPFGPLHLILQFMASDQMPLEWAELEKHAAWLAPGAVPAAVQGMKIKEQVLQLLLTDGAFIELALHNENHFSPLNWDAFETGYARALDELRTHLANPLPDPATAPLPAAVLARVAFSLHYLTDAFSASHMRVPRAALGTHGAIAAKLMHDIDGRVGLTVGNVFGDIWRAYGDGYLHGPRDAEVKELHRKFASAMTDGDVDANYVKVMAAVAEAVLLMHYHAQHWRESGNAPAFPMLDAARNEANASSTRFLGADRAPYSSRFPTGTEWLAKSRGDILAYLRKHQPSPASPGSWPAAMTNIPPLLDGALNIDGSGAYRATGPFGRHRIAIKLYHELVIDFSDLYYLARVREASKVDLPGVPLDTLVLAIFDKLQPDQLKGHIIRPL